MSQPDGKEQPQVACSNNSSEPPDGYLKPPERAHAVRFASQVNEIEPSVAPQASPELSSDTSPTPDQLQVLTNSLQSANLQEQRAKNYAFEPVSLPPSRVPSNETTPGATPQQSHSSVDRPSPVSGARVPELASPPLTPAGTSAVESSSKAMKPAVAGPNFGSQAITPQASGQDEKPLSPRIGLQHRPASTDNISYRRAADQGDGARSHRRGMFSLGPAGGQSLPVSRETSPSRNRASQFFSRPMTPQGDANDPYAASRRPAQSRSTANIEDRFLFKKKKHGSSPSSSSASLSKPDNKDKRSSGIFGHRNKSGDLHPTGTESTLVSQHGSMADLRRFFKVGGGNKSKKAASPTPSRGGGSSSVHSKSNHQVPFADDHGLTSKYGKIGRVLGSGAGGSVRLMKRNEDNTVFAVKEFRPRHSYETEKEYVKKLTAEFCIGSALHHGNIIETLDIMQEKGKWFEVMEYAPYDLFAIVMTGKMTKPEITCAFLQILNGVTYLHSMGLAHRDLKLDNVVVSENGIMKIIDFGSAHVFKYPFESEIVLASGVVGSDPYLAPEVYDERRYDPQAVDIWSLAIVFCCMSLRRFPWKVPRLTDNSYKLFAAEPTPGHDPKKLVLPSKSTNDLGDTPQRDMFPGEIAKPGKSSEAGESAEGSSGAPGSSARGGEVKEVIRGPWRLLRMLPRESRHIIARMLTINPKERAQMFEILADPWVSETPICSQVDSGQVVKADDHTHILEPPAPPSTK
ncbi:Pkinase-domain-containing protein [Xylariomycetidae sp. FL2044]|nr:Pkinase-domain-containing protein [Xylariomycetidae sp. FL2044]